MENDVLDRLVRVCDSTLGMGPETILAGRSTDFAQMGADSLDVVEIVTEAEDEFDVILSTEKADRVRSFDGLLKLIQEELDKKQSAPSEG